MRSGTIVADLRQLWEGNGVPYVPELIAAKRQGEHHKLAGVVAPQPLADDVARLRAELEDAAVVTSLPERARAHESLHRLIVGARLGSITQHELSRR